MERKPLFVKIDDYKDVIDIMTLIKKKINDAKSILVSINDIKAQEDSEIEQWNNKIEDIEKKIEYIDKNLFE
jgi:hypothetical protein